MYETIAVNPSEYLWNFSAFFVYTDEFSAVTFFVLISVETKVLVIDPWDDSGRKTKRRVRNANVSRTSETWIQINNRSWSK